PNAIGFYGGPAPFAKRQFTPPKLNIPETPNANVKYFIIAARACGTKHSTCDINPEIKIAAQICKFFYYEFNKS
ncbi:hypothetical protein, partial [Novosphingobium sp. Rr 2-17]|uniref:hypothetical protein n=1 Tax=Novosphingobium sp. Rr 2-17 TaxID=555793 RepID=UPI001ED90074